MPIACSDQEPRENVVPWAEASAGAQRRSIAPDHPQPRASGWLLVQLRSFAVLPAPAHCADGSSDVLVTTITSLEPSPWRDLATPRAVTIVVPTALPLHGIDLVLQTCEVQVDLGGVSRVDVMVVRDPHGFPHERGGRLGSSLHVLLPQP
ncbi:MAG: hypothetical protein JNL12_22960 [Planctomycetes bacterium]|nr:hypothetical protein [Planctomycetota bacterium]